MNLVEAWQVVPATVFSSMLTGICDRVLQLALDIEAENPAAGEAPPGDVPIAEARVTQIFNQTFYGDHTAVATSGSGNVSQQASTSIDISMLEVALRGLASSW
jgi:hypothetical protein